MQPMHIDIFLKIHDKFIFTIKSFPEIDTKEIAIL
jgi:hypothetical protein